MEVHRVSKGGIHSPNLHFLQKKVLLLRENFRISKGCSATGTTLVEIVLYPDAVFETHTNTYTRFSVTNDERLVFTTPLIHLWLLALLVSKDKHLAPTTLPHLNRFYQECAKLVTLVFLEDNDGRLHSLRLVEKSCKGSTITRRTVDLAPIVQTVKNW